MPTVRQSSSLVDGGHAAALGCRHVPKPISAATIVVVKAVKFVDVLGVVIDVGRYEFGGPTGGIEKDGVGHCRELALGIAVGALTLPYDLVAKVLVPENAVHHHLDVVTGGLVAVEEDRPGRPQNAFHVEQPLDHIDEVRKQLGLCVA